MSLLDLFWRSVSKTNEKGSPNHQFCWAMDKSGSSERSSTKQNKEEPPASTLQLFSFATCNDWILIALSVIVAAASGTALPLFFLSFSDSFDMMGSTDLSANSDEFVDKAVFTLVYVAIGWPSAPSLPSGPRPTLAPSNSASATRPQHLSPNASARTPRCPASPAPPIPPRLLLVGTINFPNRPSPQGSG